MNAILNKKTVRGLALATLVVWSFAHEADAQEVSKEDLSTARNQPILDIYGY